MAHVLFEALVDDYHMPENKFIYLLLLKYLFLSKFWRKWWLDVININKAELKTK